MSGESRGYILEVFDGHFILPNLGPIGNLKPFYNNKKQTFLVKFNSYKIPYNGN